MPIAEPSAPPTTIALPILTGSEYDKYMLRNPAEVLAVLRQLQQRFTQLTVFSNEGQDMLLTVVVEVSPDHLILDIGADEEVNRRVEAAERHYCIGQLDRVRIQFLLGRFNRIDHNGQPAFFATMPKEVLRLQRREFYRLSAPAARPLRCRIPMTLPDGRAGSFDAIVLDISVGGVGLTGFPEDLPLEVGQILTNCRIELPEEGIIETTLRVCQTGISFIGNQTRLRAGCEFVSLPGPKQTLIQRYIIKVERERKARASGLGF